MLKEIVRKLIVISLVISFVTPIISFAKCDFSKDIEKHGEDRYSYTKDCHKEVGRLVTVEIKRAEQVEKLEKVIELKDLTIVKSHERMEMWKDTTFKLEDRVNLIDDSRSTNQWLYFGLGVLTMSAAVWGAGQLK